jgi:hypothetical protein
MTNAVRLLANTNAAGSPNAFSADQIAAAHIGGAMTDIDLANLSNRVNAYMTAVGANVY